MTQQDSKKQMSHSDKRILCVGKCCVDIITVCGHYPVEDSDQQSLDYYWQRGCNASNSATVLALLGARVEIFATFFKSQEQRFLEEDLHAYGIRTDNCVHYEGDQYKSPVTIVIINKENGSRTMLSNLKEYIDLTIKDFNTKIDLNNYQWIHFEGRPNAKDIYQMIKQIQDFNMSACAPEKIKISVEIEKSTRPGLETLIGLADYVFISKVYALAQGYEGKDKAVTELSKFCKEGGTIICAWGEEGAAAKTCACDLVTSPCFPPENLVETLAAGDTFNASTILALSKGKTLEEAITFGCKVAGAKCGMTNKDGLKGLQSLL